MKRERERERAREREREREREMSLREKQLVSFRVWNYFVFTNY
jgi:hypothetical protein